SRFRHALPASVSERVVAEADLNLVGDDLSVIADTVEPLIERAWQKRTDVLAGLASERAQSGGAATLGPSQTLGALAEGRVDHLLIDPDQDCSSAAGMIPPSIGGPSDMLAERTVEAAIATAARVTSLSTEAS